MRCRNIGYRPFGSVPGEAAHNSAVLLCRLRCISRADQVVLRPKNKAHGAHEVGSLAAAEPAQENRTPVRLIGGEKVA